MHNHWLESKEDCDWLRETALKDLILPEEWRCFKFAIVQGNEDAPYAVNLYKDAEPVYTHDYYLVVFEDLSKSGVHSGHTDLLK